MVAIDLVEELHRKAAALPSGVEPVAQRARQRAVQAVETVKAAVNIDPTLTDNDRCRDIDLLCELLRQLKPLARQAEVELERRRLVEAEADQREIARLGRTNPVAPDELEALSHRCIEIADRITASALPDWNTPQRIRERSERLLPSASHLDEIADQLRRAIQPSLGLPHPADEAVRLAALADQIAVGSSS